MPAVEFGDLEPAAHVIVPTAGGHACQIHLQDRRVDEEHVAVVAAVIGVRGQSLGGDVVLDHEGDLLVVEHRDRVVGVAHQGHRVGHGHACLRVHTEAHLTQQTRQHGLGVEPGVRIRGVGARVEHADERHLTPAT